MMQVQEGTLNSISGNAFQAKPQPQMNSQGEIITPSEEQPSELPSESPSELPSELPVPTLDNFEDVISLWDTELAINPDSLCAPTDDTGLEHKIISWGHVLKSTHDLARWSEKTGARRVNGVEALDALTDLAINLEPTSKTSGKSANNSSSEPSDDISGLFNEGGNTRGRRGKPQQQWRAVEGGNVKSEVINCWPVLKSTHDQAQLSEKRGRNAVNQAGASSALEELALNQGGTQKRGRNQQRGGKQQPSAIINSWPVLKSTHDEATPGEESRVNSSTAALDEVSRVQGIQAGGPLPSESGIQGGSLQSGLDTQGGSHVQFDGTQ